MAIYSFQMKNITRGVQSTPGLNESTNSCASISFITGQKIHCDYNGRTYHVKCNNQIMYVNTVLPEGAPKSWKDPEKLWSAVEAVEKRANARLAKRVIAALPNELLLEQQIEIAESFAKIMTDMGFPVTYAIHYKSDSSGYADKPDNDCLHMNIVNRAIDSNGHWRCKKKQEYARDENGERIPRIDPTTGKQKVDTHGRKQWIRHSVESNPLDSVKFLRECREKWAEICNQYLDDDNKIDHRSYKKRGIEKIPMIHEGLPARQIEEKGGTAYVCEYNRQVKADDARIAQLQEECDFLLAEKAKCQLPTPLKKVGLMVSPESG